MTNLAFISANLHEALRAVVNGSGLEDRFLMLDALGSPDYGRTITVGKALEAAAQYLPDDERFTVEQLAIVDAACAKLGIRRPSDSKKAVANVIAAALVHARRQ